MRFPIHIIECEQGIILFSDLRNSDTELMRESLPNYTLSFLIRLFDHSLQAIYNKSLH